ncbi:hypothetical protein EON67_01305 [archaeon]|nr:MAG: hypothetical protein EON67_01305 [archaeon]
MRAGSCRSDISARFVLDSVVTVVDAKHIQYHVQPPSGNNVAGWAASVLAQHTEATRQIAYADTIILNKVDCVSSTELHTVSQLLGHLNPGARLIPATFGKVPVSSLLHTNSFDTHTYPLPIHCEDALGGTTEGPLAAARPPTVGATSHTHDKSVRAITLTSLVARRVLHVGDMRGWLTTLLQERWQDLFRMKGIFWAYDEADGDESTGPTAHVPRPFVIHGVHAELHGSFVDTAVDTAFRTDFQPAIVLIGRHLDGPALEHALHDACNESSHELQRSLAAHGIHAVSPSPSSGACDQADTHCEGKECGHEHAHEHAGGHEDARSAARSMRQRRRATGAHGA